MAPPIRTRPSSPLSQSLPSGSFHKPLIFLHQRADRLKTKHRKLTNLITWTTALSNSMKLWAMLCRATQDRQVMVESSDKMWSTGEGNGKPPQYSCLESPINSMKRQNCSPGGRKESDTAERLNWTEYSLGSTVVNNKISLLLVDEYYSTVYTASHPFIYCWDTELFPNLGYYE